MSFVETTWFSSIRERYLDDESFRLLQVALMTSPGTGPVIRGSGVIRKMRWAIEGAVKRGGLRVLYYWLPSKDTIYLFHVYQKSEMADLTHAELQVFRKLIGDIMKSNRNQADDNA